MKISFDKLYNWALYNGMNMRNRLKSIKSFYRDIGKGKILLKWLLCACFCLLIACAQVPAAGGRNAIAYVPVTVVFSGNQCFCEQHTITAEQLNNQKEIDAFVARNINRTIGISKPEIDPIEFSQNIVLAIWMGKQPTAGYGLRLAENNAQVKENTAIIRLTVTTPAPNRPAAQVITSPCMLIKLPKAQYNSLMLVSQDGKELVSLTQLK